MDIPAFRQAFPEFIDPEAYPDFAMNFWADVAARSLRPDRWDDLLTHGTQLFVAHHLVLGKRNEITADAGGVPGEVKGIVASKTVDKASASYDTKAVTSENAAFWNQTTYGQAFWRLVRMAGAGPIQL